MIMELPADITQKHGKILSTLAQAEGQSNNHHDYDANSHNTSLIVTIQQAKK